MFVNQALVYESDREGSWPAGKPRIAAGALFGLLVGGYVANAADQTVPAIMSMVQNIDSQAAAAIYNNSSLYRTSVLVVAAFLGAAVAAFLARHKGLLAGILSGSLYILALAYLLLVSRNDSSIESQAFLRLMLFTAATCLGGFVGQKLYSPEIDLDLGQAKATIFGVRWAHYFWILPLIYLAFLASAIMIVYAGITVIAADISFAFHPSLWFKLAWILGFPFGPCLVWFSLWITGASFVRFYEVMQYRQTDFRGLKKVGRVLLYGVGAPALSYTIAALGADIAHAMPKPSKGDWKIVVSIVAVILVINAISAVTSFIQTKRSRSR